jgi:Domain of unknown function (DUF929)
VASELAHPPLTRTARFAWSAVVVILIGVIALLVYALTDVPVTLRVVHRTETSTDMLRSLASVPQSVFDQVGITAPSADLQPPRQLVGQPPLTATGKPEVLFIGTEYCPFCAAERWPLIVALSRFGTFERLYDMQSSTTSVFPAIESFSFFDVAYSSAYLSFTGVEVYSNVTASDGAFGRIAELSPAQQQLVDRFATSGPVGVPTVASLDPYPFVDIGNSAVMTGSDFSPAVILRLSRPTIVGHLLDPKSPDGQAIVASANYLTASICQATGQQPTSVCSSRGVQVADRALDIG